MSTEEITEAGERHVKADLTTKGFTCLRHRESSCLSVFEVFRGTELLCLIKAKTAIHPGLSDEDSAKIKNRDIVMGGDAWLGRVSIDDAGQRLEPIIYTQL